MQAAVLMVAVPPAVEVRSARVAVHMPVVPTARDVQLTVLMVSVICAVEVRPVRVAVNVTVMVLVPMIPRLVVGLCLCACRRESQNQPRASQTQQLHS